AIALVESGLARPAASEEDLAELRGLILAFQADGAVQRSVGAAFARDPIFLLQTISRTSLSGLPATWRECLASSLAHADAAVRMEAVRCVATLQLRDFD